MSNETGSPFESTGASDDSEEGGVHAESLVAAVRDAGSAWGFTLLMVVFTGIALGIDVYTSVIYPVFFGLCAGASFLVASGRTCARYSHHRFERRHDH